MRKYITSYEGYTPICIPEERKTELIDNNPRLYTENSIEEQFNYSKIVGEYMYCHYSGGRLRRFTFGRGLLFLDNYLRAIICNNGKLVS